MASFERSMSRSIHWSIIPLTCRIHEGVVFSNRDRRTLLDKMTLLLGSLNISKPFYFVADAYYRHIQLGLIAQGLLQILSAKSPQQAWRSFGSWIRTVRPGLAPSEQVAAVAPRKTLPDFLAATAKTPIFAKITRDRIELSRSEGTSLAA